MGTEPRSRYGLETARSAVAVALPYGEGPGEPPDWALAWEAEHPGPRLAIGRFARANWYAELVARLGAASASARLALSEAGIDPGPAGAWRRLANSGLPEKRLALAAGLGRLGRHGLLMTSGNGSAVVLGVLLLPVDIGGTELPPSSAAPGAAPGTELEPACSGCGRCAASCPTGALGTELGAPDGGLVPFRRELCLQHWSSVPGELPPAVEAAWNGGRGGASGGASCRAFGGRLYGCDACQEACPRFRPDPAARTERGLLGPGLPASWLHSASDEEIRERLRGSALGMSWISTEALRRSARLALRSGGI